MLVAFHFRTLRGLFAFFFSLSWCVGNDTLQGNEEDADVENHVWICALDLEANSSSRLFTMPELASAGSLCVSIDEKRLAFDGLFKEAERLVDTHLFVSNLDGSDIKDLGLGALPSWSPNANRMVVCRYAPRGVWMMDADGSNDYRIDENGWGGRWSPNGKVILYTKQTNQSPDFFLYDVVENSRRALFGDKGNPYTRLLFNSEWSADGNRIFFKATRRDGSSEISSVSVREPRDLRVHFLRNTYANIGLIGSDQIIVPFRSSEYGTVQLHRVSINCHGPAAENAGKHVSGQFTGRNSFGAAMSADCKHVYYVSVPVAK